MRRLRFTIPRLPIYAPDTSCALYGDLGSGTVDFEHPFPPGRMPMWPGFAIQPGHLQGGHLAASHLRAVGPDGHLAGSHLLDAHLAPVLGLVVDSPSYVFGRFRHVVRIFDTAGNTQEADAFEDVRTINDGPSAVRGLRRIAPRQGGAVRFAFVPVRFHAVAGS